MQVSRSNGWTVDVAAGTISWPDVAPASMPLSAKSLGALVYFGLGYLESQAAARTVNDEFRKAYAEANGIKVKDIPKGVKVVPDSDSPEYCEALLKAHKGLFDKLLAGYEVGVREGGMDSLTEEVDKLARMWLQGLATQFTHQGKPWFTLPAGSKRRIAADSDPYDGPGYATFGEALEAFKVSTKPVSPKLLGKDSKTGASWPWKMRQGIPVGEAILAEATRRVEERNQGKAAVALGGAGEEGEAF